MAPAHFVRLTIAEAYLSQHVAFRLQRHLSLLDLAAVYLSQLVTFGRRGISVSLAAVTKVQVVDNIFTRPIFIAKEKFCDSPQTWYCSYQVKVMLPVSTVLNGAVNPRSGLDGAI